MSPVKWINGNAPMLTMLLHVVNSIGMVGLLTAAFWAGGELKTIRSYQRQAVHCSTFASWMAKTERINEKSTWRGANIYDAQKQVEQSR